MAITLWIMLAAIAIVAIPTFTMHNALRLAVNSSGDAQQSAKQTARRAWWIVAGLTLAIASLAFIQQPELVDHFSNYAWAISFPLLAAAGLIGVRLWEDNDAEWLTYFASTVYMFGMITTAIFVAFPV